MICKYIKLDATPREIDAAAGLMMYAHFARARARHYSRSAACRRRNSAAPAATAGRIA